jgi:hypothetical protein
LLGKVAKEEGTKWGSDFKTMGKREQHHVEALDGTPSAKPTELGLTLELAAVRKERDKMWSPPLSSPRRNRNNRNTGTGARSHRPPRALRADHRWHRRKIADKLLTAVGTAPGVAAAKSR